MPTNLRIVFLLLCAFPLISKGQNNSTVDYKSTQAISSNLAAEAVGVNTHLNYRGSVYDLHYDDIIRPQLIELGIKHIRDHFGDTEINERYRTLAHENGIKLLVIGDDGGRDLEKMRDEIIRLNQLNIDKPVVELIEPANERDNGWKGDWQKLCSYMSRFKDVFKENPTTRLIPILGPSFANTKNSAMDFALACKDVQRTMELGNLHAYSGLYPESPLAGGWGIGLGEAISRYRKLSGIKPFIETESGYKMSEGISGHPAVSQRTAAKYAPRLVLSRLKAGVSRIYFYQLINNSENFGLLNVDGSPRLQYTALKNFISLMRDPGPNFSPKKLNFSLSGNLADIQHELFQKRDGKFLLLMWQGKNGSKGGSKDNDYNDINNAERSINLMLDVKAKQIKIYRPSFNTMPDGNGIVPVNTYQNTKSIIVGIPDHVICIEITK